MDTCTTMCPVMLRNHRGCACALINDRQDTYRSRPWVDLGLKHWFSVLYFRFQWFVFQISKKENCLNLRLEMI